MVPAIQGSPETCIGVAVELQFSACQARVETRASPIASRRSFQASAGPAIGFLHAALFPVDHPSCAACRNQRWFRTSPLRRLREPNNLGLGCNPHGESGIAVHEVRCNPLGFADNLEPQFRRQNLFPEDSTAAAQDVDQDSDGCRIQTRDAASHSCDLSRNCWHSQ